MSNDSVLTETGGEIADLEQKIRQYVNSPRKQYELIKDRDNWYALCSATDAIGDAEIGLDSFLSNPFPTDVSYAWRLYT